MPPVGRPLERLGDPGVAAGSPCLHPKETMGEEGAGLCILPDALLMIFKSLYAQGRADILINLHVAFKESQMERDVLASISSI